MSDRRFASAVESCVDVLFARPDRFVVKADAGLPAGPGGEVYAAESPVERAEHRHRRFIFLEEPIILLVDRTSVQAFHADGMGG